MPTWFEAAALSLHVYRDKDEPVLPEGWRLILDCPDEYQKEGYFGAVYAKHIEHNIYDIILAHRGTQGFPAVVEDIELFLFKKVPAQFSAGAIPFINYALEFLNKNFSQRNLKLMFTGHSLGATLAELSVAKWSDSLYSPRAITFESPGSKPFILNNKELPETALEYVKRAVATSNADVDIINSIFEHVGLKEYLVPHYVGYSYVSSDIDGYPIPPGDLYFFINFTVEDQHKMLKMYEYYKDPERIKLFPLFPKANNLNMDTNFQWPVGIENAYKYYLNYCPEGQVSHSRYWEEYIKKCWENYPNIHACYNNQWFEFRDYFLRKLLKHSYGIDTAHNNRSKCTII